MSGVGKTTLAYKLPSSKWFHYSGDYRIGTKYLGEPILDNIKRQAMQVGFLRELLRNDSIYIASNITVHNLQPVSTFLGKIGRPDLGGLPVAEFKRRQRLHREAEIGAMRDVAEFIDKAQEIYGYDHFINDAGGSSGRARRRADRADARREHADPVPEGRRGDGARARAPRRQRSEAALLQRAVPRSEARSSTSPRPSSKSPSRSCPTSSCGGSFRRSSRIAGRSTRRSRNRHGYTLNARLAESIDERARLPRARRERARLS